MTNAPILIVRSDEDEEHVAIVPDRRRCSAPAESGKEAAREAQTAPCLRFGAAHADRVPIPAPTLRPTRSEAKAAVAPR